MSRSLSIRDDSETSGHEQTAMDFYIVLKYVKEKKDKKNTTRHLRCYTAPSPVGHMPNSGVLTTTTTTATTLYDDDWELSATTTTTDIKSYIPGRAPER